MERQPATDALRRGRARRRVPRRVRTRCHRGPGQRLPIAAHYCQSATASARFSGTGPSSTVATRGVGRYRRRHLLGARARLSGPRRAAARSPSGCAADAIRNIRRGLLSRCRVRRTAHRRARRPRPSRFSDRARCRLRTGSRRRRRRPIDNPALLRAGLRPAMSDRGQDRPGAAAARARGGRSPVRTSVCVPPTRPRRVRPSTPRIAVTTKQ